MGGGVDQLTGDTNALNVLRDMMRQDPLDGTALTEVFRRIPGFLAMMQDVANTGGGAASPDGDQFSLAVAELADLLHHLRCNKSFYVQQYLAYVGEVTSKRLLVDLVDQAFEQQPGGIDLRRAFDPEGVYVDRDVLVVPGLPVTGAEFAEFVTTLGDGPTLPADAFTLGDEVVVPADGVHLEVAAGTCRLEDLPAPASAASSVD